MTEFVTGDVVDFELQEGAPDCPRWINDVDLGGSGVWVRGIVLSVDRARGLVNIGWRGSSDPTWNTWTWIDPPPVGIRKERPGYAMRLTELFSMGELGCRPADYPEYAHLSSSHRLAQCVAAHIDTLPIGGLTGGLPEPRKETPLLPEHQDWPALAQRVNEVNDANKWDRPTQKAILGKFMLVITELDEAVLSEEELNVDPLAEELADMAVRLLHILESLWPGGWVLRGDAMPEVSAYQPLQVLLWPILRQLCRATEAWRDCNQADERIACESALGETRRLARSLQIDLYAEAAKKVEKNATRGPLHGRTNPAG